MQNYFVFKYDICKSTFSYGYRYCYLKKIGDEIVRNYIYRVYLETFDVNLIEYKKDINNFTFICELHCEHKNVYYICMCTLYCELVHVPFAHCVKTSSIVSNFFLQSYEKLDLKNILIVVLLNFCNRKYNKRI